MKKYVVTGVTGRSGSSVAASLLANGLRPIVMARDRERALDWVARGALLAVGSLDDQRFLEETLHDAAGLFVLLPENVTPGDFYGTRCRMADTVSAAVRCSGVPHVVVLSALAAVLPEGNGPARALHHFEHVLQASGATITVLRACYFQENLASAVPPALHAGIYPNFFPSADVPFPMIATADVGRVAADALTHQPPRSEVVDLFGPGYSIRDVALRLGRALDRELRIVDIPPARHVAALTEAGIPHPIAEAVAELFAAFSAGLIAPRGDRIVVGTTTIDTVIAECLRRHLGAKQLAV